MKNKKEVIKSDSFELDLGVISDEDLRAITDYPIMALVPDTDSFEDNELTLMISRNRWF